MRRSLTALFIFAVSFGYLEASVVVYLRALYEPMRQKLYPSRAADELFPLIREDQLRSAGPEHIQRLAIELGREAGTMIMLASVAFAVARNLQQWAAAFAIVFGVWDISFYLFLKLLLNWPASLLTWDILFLIPVPWVGPVLAPVLVSASMIAAGLLLFRRDFPLRWFHWAAIFSGAFLLILAFTWDFRNTSAGGYPNPFNWPLFATGEMLGLGGFLLAAKHIWR